MIAVLILTRGRPAGLVAAVQALHATASGDVPINYVLCCDDDDPTIDQSVALLEHLPITISRNPRPDALGGAWNLGARAAGEWDMALLTGDDTVPACWHWDRHMSARDDLPAFAWQELNDPTNVTYPVVSRRWFDAVGGKMVPAWFPYWFNDTWLAEVHMMAFGQPLPIASELPMAGRRGTTREMRELAFWFSVFTATRGMRENDAHMVAAAFRRPEPVRGQHAAFFAAWDAEQMSRVPLYNKAFAADTVPPTPRYLRLRAKAERLLDRPAFDYNAAARRERDPLPLVPFMVSA